MHSQSRGNQPAIWPHITDLVAKCLPRQSMTSASYVTCGIAQLSMGKLMVMDVWSRTGRKPFGMRLTASSVASSECSWNSAMLVGDPWQQIACIPGAGCKLYFWH